MERSKLLKVLGIVLVLFLILNLVLFVLRKITTGIFWAVIIVMAFFAWKILPRLKK